MYTTKAISITSIVLCAACLLSPAEAQVSRLDKRFNINKSKPVQKTISRTTQKRTTPTKAVTKPSQKQIVQTQTGVSPTARKALPCLMTILDPKYKGAPVYSLEQGNENEIKFRYQWNMMSPQLKLLHASDYAIILNEERLGALDSDMTGVNYISIWDARTTNYVSSMNSSRLGTGQYAEFRVLFDSVNRQFYFAGLFGEPHSGMDAYCCAYDLKSNVYEEMNLPFQAYGGDRVAWKFKTKFKSDSFPKYLSFDNDISGGGSCSIAELSEKDKLLQIKQLKDFAYSFQSNNKQNIDFVDFSSLAVKEKIPDMTTEESEEMLDVGAIRSLSKDKKLEAVKIGENYWFLFPKDDVWGAELDAAGWKIGMAFFNAEKASYDGDQSGFNEMYIYNQEDRKLYPLPRGLFNSIEKIKAYIVFAVGQSDCGKRTINACSFNRFGGDWTGVRLLSDSSIGEEDILFEGNRVKTVDESWFSLEHTDINYKPSYNQSLKSYNAAEKLPVAYRIKTSPFKLSAEGTSVASLLSIWNRVPSSTKYSYWIAAETNYCQLFLMDDETKTGKLIHQWSGVWSRKNTALPVWMPEKRWICLPVVENQWDIYAVSEDYASVSKLCSVYMGAGDAYAIILPNGKYAGTPGCESFLYKEDGDVRMGMSALALWRNRPAEVLEAIGGNADDIAALRETTKRWLKKQGFDPDNMPAEPRLSEFPVAEVTMPELFCESDSVKFSVKLKATARDIKKLEVRADGVLIPQSWGSELELAAGEEKEVMVEVPLVSGQNWLEVTPIDVAGIAGDTFRFRTICKQEKLSELYVVAIGVSDYDADELKLQYAAKDAKDIAKAFENYAHGSKHVLVLTDKEVKDRSVLDRVKVFLADAKVNDRVVLYVAGHGMLDDELNYYYAPSGFDSERIVETGIPMGELTACLQGVHAHHRLLLLDTCHSGLLGEEGEDKLAASGVTLPHGVRAIQKRGMKIRKIESPLNVNQRKRYIEELFSQGNEERGICIIAGTAGAEYALESSSWSNGVFTASIMQALQDAQTDLNGDAKVSVNELQQVVSQKVFELTGGTQKPSTVAMDGGDSFIILGKTEEYAVSGFDNKSDTPPAAWTPPTTGNISLMDDRSSLDPMIANMQALRCREADSQLYQKRLLTLLPMIRNGADVNLTLPETKGNTALHYSCAIGSWSITQWLVEHGANVNALTNAGKTPLDCVGSDNAKRIRELLVSRGARHSTELSRVENNMGAGGDADSLNNLGLAYQYGKNGKPKNYDEAARYYRLAADMGHAGAQNNLGFCYHNGWGVPQDMGQAAMWYRRSAEQGNAWGQSNYGTCLEFGWGVSKNLPAAIDMYRRAAAQGHASAKKHLKRHGITI